MPSRVEIWKDEADGLWFAEAFDPRAASRLVAEIGGARLPDPMTKLAGEALASLKAGMEKRADPYRKDVARRRFGAVREILHELARPRFGRRVGPPTSVDGLARDRLALGLPAVGLLTERDIGAAFKRAAKIAHPDRGGDAARFSDLVRARDTLLAAREFSGATG